VATLKASNPDVKLETLAWPDDVDAVARATTTTGAAWLRALAGADVVVRSGFDDDPMLRAAVRLGVPAILTRGRGDRIDVVSFRQHGPCPHAPLDVPYQVAVPSQDGPGAVVAAHIAAAEALAGLAGATTGNARARHITVGGGSDDAAGDAPQTRAVDIPWKPECFACGGSGLEMSFA
jgi:hypothetical protein